ncbi:hypothetical protein CUZ56_01630 [Saezia sanguinis]|jgi:hypothetical protein|uniref:Uncharacterized protein n=1 Tax=Saezia sanguinis TaxID=1965230 RepID=A0A433SDR9_9BURK|nr:hypothetical protein CUZ56_01630 [Saezia sanguinis]
MWGKSVVSILFPEDLWLGHEIEKFELKETGYAESLRYYQLQHG